MLGRECREYKNNLLSHDLEERTQLQKEIQKKVHFLTYVNVGNVPVIEDNAW